MFCADRAVSIQHQDESWPPQIEQISESCKTCTFLYDVFKRYTTLCWFGCFQKKIHYLITFGVFKPRKSKLLFNSRPFISVGPFICLIYFAFLPFNVTNQHYITHVRSCLTWVRSYDVAVTFLPFWGFSILFMGIVFFNYSHEKRARRCS